MICRSTSYSVRVVLHEKTNILMYSYFNIGSPCLRRRGLWRCPRWRVLRGCAPWGLLRRCPRRAGPAELPAFVAGAEVPAVAVAEEVALAGLVASWPAWVPCVRYGL